MKWTYGICESCLRNSHKKVEMVRERLISGDPEGKYSKEVWVCPICGYSREL